MSTTDENEIMVTEEQMLQLASIMASEAGRVYIQQQFANLDETGGNVNPSVVVLSTTNDTVDDSAPIGSSNKFHCQVLI